MFSFIFCNVWTKTKIIKQVNADLKQNRSGRVIVQCRTKINVMIFFKQIIRKTSALLTRDTKYRKSATFVENRKRELLVVCLEIRYTYSTAYFVINNRLIINYKTSSVNNLYYILMQETNRVLWRNNDCYEKVLNIHLFFSLLLSLCSPASCGLYFKSWYLRISVDQNITGNLKVNISNS